MSERLESNIIPFKGKNYTTVTTIEDGNNAEPKKTQVYEIISEERYNDIAEADGNFDNLSISPTHGRRVLLLTTSGAIQKNASGSTTTAYADSDFKREIQQTGKTSLNGNLNAGSVEVITTSTPQTREQVRKFFPEFSNTQEEQSIANALQNLDFSSNNVPLQFTANRKKVYENLAYPEDIRTSKQDRIIFGMRYLSKNREIRFNLRARDRQGNETIVVNPLQINNRQTEQIEGSVTLPIPGGINDKNSVKFDGDTLNILQGIGAGAVLNPTGAIQAGADFLRQAVTLSPEQLAAALNSDTGSNLVSALRIGLAQQVSGGNLFSRIGGGVLNPNLELLFQAPSLRVFDFTFTMSARSKTEATEIKKIIRFFKQGMSVKKSADNIFIVSPNIFTIKYKTGDGRDHPSIGRIKNCALTDVTTTYGNGNTYMTYDDPDRTMTQYKIDLTFKELDPITEDDYNDPSINENNETLSIPDNQIGF